MLIKDIAKSCKTFHLLCILIKLSFIQIGRGKLVSENYKYFLQRRVYPRIRNRGMYSLRVCVLHSLEAKVYTALRQSCAQLRSRGVHNLGAEACTTQEQRRAQPRSRGVHNLGAEVCKAQEQRRTQTRSIWGKCPYQIVKKIFPYLLTIFILPEACKLQGERDKMDFLLMRIGNEEEN